MRLSNLKKKNLPTSQKKAHEENVRKENEQISSFNQMLDGSKGRIILLKETEVRETAYLSNGLLGPLGYVYKDKTLCVLLSGRMYIDSIPFDDCAEFHFGRAPIFTSCNYEKTRLKVLLKLFVDGQVCFYFLSCDDFDFVSQD